MRTVITKERNRLMRDKYLMLALIKVNKTLLHDGPVPSDIDEDVEEGEAIPLPPAERKSVSHLLAQLPHPLLLSKPMSFPLLQFLHRSCPFSLLAFLMVCDFKSNRSIIHFVNKQSLPTERFYTAQ